MTKHINHIHELPSSYGLDDVIRCEWWISGSVLAYLVHPLATETTRVELEMLMDEQDMNLTKLETELYEARCIITAQQRDLDLCHRLMDESNENFELKMGMSHDE